MEILIVFIIGALAGGLLVRLLMNGRIETLKQAEASFTTAFEALSAEALRRNNQSFLDLAETHLKSFQEGARGDLEKRQQAIVDLVLPVSRAWRNSSSASAKSKSPVLVHMSR